MGDISEMVTQGQLCGGCGCALAEAHYDNTPPGFPVFCSDECAADAWEGAMVVEADGTLRKRETPDEN